MTPTSPCAFERSYDRPCLICRTPQRASRLEDAPDHPDHLALATAADRLAAAQLYAERGLHLVTVEIAALRPHERLVLDAWAAGAAPLGASFAMRAHVAGPVTVMAGEPPLQACTRCHLVLQDHAVITADGAYPVGAHVGLDCDGVPRPAEEAPDYGD